MTGLSGGVKGEGPSEQRVIRTRTREHDHLHGHEGKRTTASASERSKQQERQRAGGRLRTSRVLAGALRQVVAAWCAMVRLRLRLRLRLQPRPQLQLQLRLRLWLRLQLQLRLRRQLRLRLRLRLRTRLRLRSRLERRCGSRGAGAAVDAAGARRAGVPAANTDETMAVSRWAMAAARRERAPTWRRGSGRAAPGVLVPVLPAGVMALVLVRLTMPLLLQMQVRGT